MKTFTKKYQLWEAVDTGESAFALIEFDTLSHAILAPKKYSWYITKAASVQITDAEEQSYAPIPLRDRIDGGGSGVDKPTTIHPESRPVEQTEKSPEEIAADELAARYTNGPVAPIA